MLSLNGIKLDGAPENTETENTDSTLGFLRLYLAANAAAACSHGVIPMVLS